MHHFQLKKISALFISGGILALAKSSTPLPPPPSKVKWLTPKAVTQVSCIWLQVLAFQDSKLCLYFYLVFYDWMACAVPAGFKAKYHIFQAYQKHSYVQFHTLIVRLFFPIWSGMALLYIHLASTISEDEASRQEYLGKALHIVEPSLQRLKGKRVTFCCGDAGIIFEGIWEWKKVISL